MNTAINIGNNCFIETETGLLFLVNSKTVNCSGCYFFRASVERECPAKNEKDPICCESSKIKRWKIWIEKKGFLLLKNEVKT